MSAEHPSLAAIFALSTLVLIPSRTLATPLQFLAQGRLTDTVGRNLDGENINITVRVFDAPTGGTLLYEESKTQVPVYNGNFQVAIGGTPTPSSPKASLDQVFEGSARYLEFQAEGETAMLPRQPLLSTPNAIQSGVAENARSLAPNAVAAGDLSVQGILDAAGFLLNGAQLDSGLYVAFFTINGVGTYTLNLNTGQVSGGELVFMNGKKFPQGSTAVAMPVIQSYNVGFCQVGNGEYVLVNEKRVASITDISNVTVRDTNYNCAGSGVNGAIFVGR